MENVITKTGQSWKMKTTIVALLLSGVSMAYAQFNINTIPNKSFFYFMIGGAFIGLMSFMFACVCIKCPNCGSKWVWSAVSGTDHKEWLFWLNTMGSCPKCGEPKDTSR